MRMMRSVLESSELELDSSVLGQMGGLAGEGLDDVEQLALVPAGELVPDDLKELAPLLLGERPVQLGADVGARERPQRQ